MITMNLNLLKKDFFLFIRVINQSIISSHIISLLFTKSSSFILNPSLKHTGKNSQTATPEIIDDRRLIGALGNGNKLQHRSLHSTDPCGGLACVQVASDGFTSFMIRGDKKEEGRDRDRAGEAVGEEEKAREERETLERRASTMMWLTSIHKEYKSSLCSTTVISEWTERKRVACSS